MPRRSGSVVVILLTLALPAPLLGQSLSDAFIGLFTFGECGDALCLPVNAAQHGDHYLPGAVQGQDNLLAFFSSAIGASIANLPAAAAAGGVNFRFEGGVPVAEEVSAGPIFGERAQTLTRGRLLVSGSLTGASFQQVRGLGMDALETTFVHENIGNAAWGDPAFEGDVIEVKTSMDVSVVVASLAASYGVTDNIDIGVVIPFVRASLSGTSDAAVVPVGESTPHQFGTEADPSNTAHASAEGTASGVGDLGVRVKAGFQPSGDLGFAVLGEVRLPTGDEADFLGSGETSIRALGVVSGRRGDFHPHLNAGVQLRGGEGYTNAALLTVGFDHLITPTATLAVDLLTNWQLGEGIEFAREATYDIPAGRTVSLTNVRRIKDHLVDLSIGGKFAAGTAVRALTNVTFPLNAGGMRPGVGWTIGLEYDFF
jgi:hypothetical protein